jgi:hypothetical protein
MLSWPKTARRYSTLLGMAGGFLARLATLWTKRQLLTALETNSMLEVKVTTGLRHRRRRDLRAVDRSAMADFIASRFLRSSARVVCEVCVDAFGR